MATLFPIALFDVPQRFRDAPGMEYEGKRRAADLLARQMSKRGLSPSDVAAFGNIPDAATVRSFLAAESWPWARTLKRLEEGAGLEPGSLMAAARGDDISETPHDGDRVVAAIEASTLTRANKHRLIGSYYDMLDGQSEGVTA